MSSSLRAARFLLWLAGLTTPVGAAILPSAAGDTAPQSPDAGEATAPDAAGEKPGLDGRRVGGRFLPNLGRNLVGVVSRDNLEPFLIVAGVTGVGAFFDDDVQSYFGAERRAPWLGDAGEQLGKPYIIVPMALALYGAGRLDHRHQRFRDATYDIAQLTVVAAAYTTVLKYATQRKRPDGSDKLAFPSGHTSNAFAWATIGAHYYGWKVAVPGYAVAGLVGVSRMEKNAHYLSDVLAGAGLGYLSARAVIRKDSEPTGPGTHVSLAPARDARGGGAGLAVTLTF